MNTYEIRHEYNRIWWVEEKKNINLLYHGY